MRIQERTIRKKLMRKGGVAGLGIGALGLGVSPFLYDDKKKKARAKEALMRKKMALDKRQTMKRRQMDSNEAGVLSREELIKRHRAKQKGSKRRRPSSVGLVAGTAGAVAGAYGTYKAYKEDKKLQNDPKYKRRVEENRKKRREKSKIIKDENTRAYDKNVKSGDEYRKKKEALGHQRDVNKLINEKMRRANIKRRRQGKSRLRE